MPAKKSPPPVPADASPDAPPKSPPPRPAVWSPWPGFVLEIPR